MKTKYYRFVRASAKQVLLSLLHALPPVTYQGYTQQLEPESLNFTRADTTEEKLAGKYEIEFDAKKYNLRSGVYFVELKITGINKILYTQTKKLSLVK